METQKSSRLKSGLIMIAIPLFIMAVNYLAGKYLDLGLAVVYIAIGFLIAFIALIIAIIGFILPLGKLRRSFFTISTIVSIISFIPAAFFSSALLLVSVTSTQAISLQNEKNYVYVANHLVKDLKNYKMLENRYPENLEEYFPSTDYRAAYYKENSKYFDRIHYVTSEDNEDFLIYIDLSVSKSRLTKSSDFQYMNFITEPRLGIDCAHKSILCLN